MKTDSWAKLSSRIGEDGALCELAEVNPLAALLWTWSISTADLYGLLPGSPREYRACVAPGLMIDLADVRSAIDAQVTAGLVTAYEDDGTPLLYLPNYHRYQSVNWWAAKESRFTLPECWQVPPDLQAIIDDGALAKGNRTLSRCGITGARNAQPIGRGRRGDRVVGEANPTLTPGEQDVDVDVDVDKDKAVRTAPEEENLEGDDTAAEVRADVAFEFQRLWPTGIPNDVRDPIMREVAATDPDIAVMAARKTVSNFEHKKFDRWAVRKYFISTAQGMTLDQKREEKAGGTADRRRRENDEALMKMQREVCDVEDHELRPAVTLERGEADA